jgi:sugar lactone lactonase YvrE
MSSRAEPVLEVRADLGEGPLWDAARGRLLFVDIMRGHVHAFDPVTARDEIVDVGRPVGAVACTRGGDWIAAAGQGFYRVGPESGQVALVAEATRRRDVRMNDGYVDPCGSFWAGTMSLEGRDGQGTLYRLDADGSVHEMLAPVTTSNGIDWSPDGTLAYYVDTRTRRVDVFDFDRDRRRLTGRRTFVDLTGETGRPDGLIVDRDGGVWVALWRGGSVRRYRPDARLDDVIDVPAALVTKCAFGGPDLADLFITTARGGLSPGELEAQPLAGAIFRASPGARGQAPRFFGG